MYGFSHTRLRFERHKRKIFASFILLPAKQRMEAEWMKQHKKKRTYKYYTMKVMAIKAKQYTQNGKAVIFRVEENLFCHELLLSTYSNFDSQLFGSFMIFMIFTTSSRLSFLKRFPDFNSCVIVMWLTITSAFLDGLVGGYFINDRTFNVTWNLNSWVFIFMRFEFYFDRKHRFNIISRLEGEWKFIDLWHLCNLNLAVKRTDFKNIFK